MMKLMAVDARKRAGLPGLKSQVANPRKGAICAGGIAGRLLMKYFTIV